MRTVAMVLGTSVAERDGSWRTVVVDEYGEVCERREQGFAWINQLKHGLYIGKIQL